MQKLFKHLKYNLEKPFERMAFFVPYHCHLGEEGSTKRKQVTDSANLTPPDNVAFRFSDIIRPTRGQIHENMQSGGPDAKAWPCIGFCALELFCVLIFWILLDQAKSI
ncbi:hypothetical protein [Mucilaginibacter agri]|uniref:Uncharacterized protein n=1 Tax=Mucilaginibacter agri TaxID=2695265 RepID=A0A966DSY5_9SPHI|nr:hypothetical protein [Mucilaginibacter agri]NCD70075.1 hypothetical protein [Mucilaginibacter agri]